MEESFERKVSDYCTEASKTEKIAIAFSASAYGKPFSAATLKSEYVSVFNCCLWRITAP